MTSVCEIERVKLKCAYGTDSRDNLGLLQLICYSRLLFVCYFSGYILADMVSMLSSSGLSGSLAVTRTLHDADCVVAKAAWNSGRHVNLTQVCGLKDVRATVSCDSHLTVHMSCNLSSPHLSFTHNSPHLFTQHRAAAQRRGIPFILLESLRARELVLKLKPLMMQVSQSVGRSKSRC